MEVIDISYSDIHQLGELPQELKALLCMWSKLESLPELPEGLEKLDIRFTNVRKLPRLPSTLKKIYCSRSLLGIDGDALPEFPEGFEKFIAQETFIERLPDQLPASLRYLDCINTPLRSVPALPEGLETFCCSGTRILEDERAFPVLPPNLKCLAVNDLDLSRTDLVLPASLRELMCANSGIRRLPELPASLKKLYCSFNPIRELPVLPERLTELSCADTLIENLPEIPQRVHLLRCEGTRIETLPVLPRGLLRLLCARTDILTLPAGLPELVELDLTECNQLGILPASPILDGEPLRAYLRQWNEYWGEVRMNQPGRRRNPRPRNID